VQEAEFERLREQFSGTRYVELVQHHLARQSQRDRIAGIRQTVLMLPPSLRPLTERFIDEWNERAYDQAFWSMDTAVILDEIIASARWLCIEAGVEPDCESLFNLFNIITMNYAYLAYDQPWMRKFMRIDAQRVRPWPRFWARLIDTTLAGWVLAYALAYLAPGVARWWARLPGSQHSLVSAAIGSSILLIEPMLIGGFGTTPGKWLLNIRLRDSNGHPLRFNRALERSFEVWWRGMACGIPFAGFLAQVIAHDHLVRTGMTSWDRRLGIRVQQEPLTAARFVFAAVVIVVLLYVTYWR